MITPSCVMSIFVGGRFGVRWERDAGAIENRVFVLFHQIKHRGIGVFAPLDGQFDRAGGDLFAEGIARAMNAAPQV